MDPPGGLGYRAESRNQAPHSCTGSQATVVRIVTGGKRAGAHFDHRLCAHEMHDAQRLNMAIRHGVVEQVQLLQEIGSDLLECEAKARETTTKPGVEVPKP